MLAVSLANVIFNIPDSTPDGTDILTSGVDVVDIRWPENLVFSPPDTRVYGDLYLITKQDERMVARLTGSSNSLDEKIAHADLFQRL